MDATKDTRAAATSPCWWNDHHTSAWERIKEAFSRDWEQTKADFSKKKGHELDQNVADTVKQAVGADPVPPPSVPNAKPEEDFKTAEPALRYGHGAATHFAEHGEWDAPLEQKLKRDWTDLKSGHDWDAVKTYVRQGWDRAHRKS